MRSVFQFHPRTMGVLRSIVIALCVVLAGNEVALGAAAPLDAQAVKVKVAARGTGNGVNVTESDGSRIKGTITTIRDDDFDVIAKGSAQPKTIRYANVSALRNDGKSVGRKIGTGLVIGTVAFATFIVVGVLVWAAIAH